MMRKSVRAPLLLTIVLLGYGVHLRADSMAYATGIASTSISPSGAIESVTSVFGTLDLDTGVFSQIATLNNIFVDDLALSSNGTLDVLSTSFGAGGGLQFGTLDPTTGTLSVISSPGVNLTSIAFSPDGTLYATTVDPVQEALYTVDPNTGAIGFVADLQGGLATETDDIRFLGDTAYTTTFDASDPGADSDLYTLDLSTGAGTLIGSTATAGIFLAGAENGYLVGGAVNFSGNTGQLVTIDPATGEVTDGASTDITYNFIPFNTPEPGSYLLSIGGLVIVLARRRFQQHDGGA